MLLDDGKSIQEEKEIQFARAFFGGRYLAMYFVLLVALGIFGTIIKPENIVFCLLFLGIFSSMYFFTYAIQVSLFSNKKIAIHDYNLVLIRKNKIIKNITVYHDKDWICIKDSASLPIAVFEKSKNKEICDWIFRSYTVESKELKTTIPQKAWADLITTTGTGLLILCLIFSFA